MELIPMIMIGLGLVIIFFTAIRNEKVVSDMIFQKNIIIAILLVGIGGYILFSGMSASLLRWKFIGLILALFGFFLTFKFPYCSQYNRGMDGTAMFFGIIIFIVGLIVLIF